MKFATKVM